MKHLLALRAAAVAISALLTGAVMAQQSTPTPSPQVQQAREDGKAFAKTLKPATQQQIVNPAGVNSQAWSGTGVPTAVPQGLGAFSAPVTGNGQMTTAKALGLAGLGQKAQADCLNYVPTGDAAKDQACAAVNFLQSRCIQPSTGQAQIIGRSGATWGQTANCEGTYGAGQANISFKDGLSATDPIFSAFSAATKPDAAQAATDASCRVETVPNGPPVQETHQCTVEKNTDEATCSQTLDVKVTTTSNPAEKTVDCPPGTTVSGDSCVSTTTNDASVAWGCPGGYTLDGTSCTATTAAAATPTYSCPAGATLQGDQCLTQDNQLIPATVTYSCSSGTLSGAQCLVTTTLPATQLQSCAADETMVNGECKKITSVNATPLRTCPSPYVLQPDGSCTTSTLSDPTSAMSCPTNIGLLPGTNYCGITYSDPRAFGGCPATLEGKAFLTSIGWACVYAWAAQVYVCPTGATLIGDKCSTTTTTASLMEYTCSSGTLSGTQCLTETTRPADIAYTCPADQTLQGTQCVSTSSSPATPIYSCLAGQTLQGDQCLSSTNVFTPAAVNYSCPAGQTLQGTQCLQTITQPATPTYSCPDGQALQGTQCVTTTTTPATIRYACIDGTTPVGDQCRLRSVQTTWVSTCGPLEASAGIVLGVPK